MSELARIASIGYLRNSPPAVKVSRRLKLECNECGKKFVSAKIDPLCPKCGGADIGLRGW